MRTVLWRALVSTVVFFLIQGLIMFLPAGIDWWQGWLFLVVFVLQMMLAAIYLWRKNPEIFVARSKIHKGTKPWDRVLLLCLISSFGAMFPVAGLNHSPVPPWVIVLGYVLLTIGMVGLVWAEAVNKFAEPGVRIQTDRGHTVVDTGPYRFVRHPMYASAFPFFGGLPLALGSYQALVPAAVVAVVILVRTALEDRMLHRELPGYREYARRVRYRLVPGVW